MGLSHHCSSLPPCEASLSRLLFTCLSVSDINGRAGLPPHQQIILLTPHLSHRVSPPLCFQLYRSLAPTCTASPLCLWLSLPLRISSGVSAIKCKPGRAVSPTHTQKKHSGARRNRNNCLQKNKKTISHTSLFSVHLPWIFLSILRIILVVGIKTETCQSPSSF